MCIQTNQREPTTKSRVTDCDWFLFVPIHSQTIVSFPPFVSCHSLQPGCRCCAQKELAAIRVWTGIGTRQNAWPGVLELKVLVIKPSTIDGFAAFLLFAVDGVYRCVYI